MQEFRVKFWLEKKQHTTKKVKVSHLVVGFLFCFIKKEKKIIHKSIKITKKNYKKLLNLNLNKTRFA